MSYLTDKEKRLLFSALSREKKVCEEVDKECCREPYETPLKRVIEGLERKFYYDRFEKEIRNKAIDKFAKALTNKIVVKYCRADLTSQYVGMQTCDWIKEIAEKLKEE